jgi:hypothetical protein
MAQKENSLLSSPEVDKLATLVEEATRASKDSRRFIEPARGTLDKSKSRRHHLIFGRRGSGKTSLLAKAGSDLTLCRIPNAFIDLETFKGHAYPDVLLSILIKTLDSFDEWLETAGLNSANKTSFWKKLFGATPTSPPLDRRHVSEVRCQVQNCVSELTRLLHSEDGAQITERKSQSEKQNVDVSAESNVAASFGHNNKISSKLAAQAGTGKEAGSEVVESGKRDKIQFLLRNIILYQNIFEKIVKLSANDAYIFLDDLYHIRRPDQADVLDYFHRIVKGRSVWLKVGTIKHRTEWYHHGSQPIGLKLGDDCDEIDLDVTLEKYETAKRFLLQILQQLVSEVGLSSYEDLLTEGAIDRLVLASGGVARDFLTIFRKSIDVARERGETYRGNKINAEDVNAAAGEHDSTKRDELKRDTLEERVELERSLQKIQDFCINNKINCFLLEQDAGSKSQEIIGELVDLRFVHVIASRLSVRDRPGKLFTGYMLDISQYTGERRRRELEMISFWKREDLDKLRRSSYVFDAHDFMDSK